MLSHLERMNMTPTLQILIRIQHVLSFLFVHVSILKLPKMAATPSHQGFNLPVIHDLDDFGATRILKDPLAYGKLMISKHTLQLKKMNMFLCQIVVIQYYPIISIYS